MNRHGRGSPRYQHLDSSIPDEVQSDDLFRMLRRQAARGGETRLALAVLEDAVRCLDGNHAPWEFPPRLFRWEAEQWIESRDRAGLFSFENICSILSLDADRMRERIRGSRGSGGISRRSHSQRRHANRTIAPIRLVAGSPSLEGFIYSAHGAPEGGTVDSTF